jgi:NAD+ kinase
VGDRVRIAQAQSTIRICKISNQSFLEILRKKMRP